MQARHVITDDRAKFAAIENIKSLSREEPHEVIIRPRVNKRTLDQNAKMWSMLYDVATQVEWYGQKLSAEDWKHIFSASLNQQRAVPGLDGGFVVLGVSTSRQSKQWLSDLIEVIYAFGAEHEVKWGDENV